MGIVVQRYGLCPTITPTDLMRVGARVQRVSPLQHAIAATILQRDAWVQALILDAGIRRQIGVPGARVIALKVVDYAWQRVEPDQTRHRLGADKLQPKYGAGLRLCN